MGKSNLIQIIEGGAVMGKIKSIIIILLLTVSFLAVSYSAFAEDSMRIMIEENVVSVAGATQEFDAEGIQKAIIDAGFTPFLRDQTYNPAENAEKVLIKA